MSWLLELGRDKNKEFVIRILREIDIQVEKDINVYVKKLNEFENEVQFIFALNSEYKDYVDHIDNNNATNDVLRKVQNYLNGYRTFLNHWETFAKRNKNDDFVAFYGKSLSELYDSSFEYRFIYNLRNYAAHSGRPVSTINESFTGTKVVLDREWFISDYKKMQAGFREELKKRKEKNLDVDKSIRTVHQQLLLFHNKMINETLQSSEEEYLQAAVIILNFNKEHSKDNGEIAFTDNNTVKNLRKMQSDTSNQNIKFQELPIKIAKWIVKGSHIKFNFKGNNRGQTNSFPYCIGQVGNFYTGRKYVDREGITWVRVVQQKTLVQQDGYDKYFALYMPLGLSDEEYLQEAEKYKEESNKLFGR